MKRVLLSVILGLNIVACNRNAEDLPVTFTMDSFEHVTVPDSAGETYRNDSLFFGDPHTIRFHPDGYLVLLDIPNTEQIIVIDLETYGVQRMVKHGRGPNEIMRVRDMTVRDGDIWLSGVADRKIMRLSRSDGGRGFEFRPVCTAEEQFMRAVPVGGNRILALASASSGNRFHMLDGGGVVCDTVGSFPTVGQIAEMNPNNAIFQSDITVSPDGKHIVSVCQSLEYIDIYDGDMNLQKKLQGPQGIDPAVKVIKTDAGTRFYQDPLWLMYNDAVSDDERFMIGYIGVCVEKEEDFAAKTGSVLSFDWKGRPLKAYDFESDIVSFDMDWENNRMYCLVNRPEPEIVVYDLDDLE